MSILGANFPDIFSLQILFQMTSSSVSQGSAGQGATDCAKVGTGHISLSKSLPVPGSLKK